MELRHLATTSSVHFTFICRRSNIIAFGVNNTLKTHPLSKRFDHRFSSIHSELAAIVNFPYPVSELKRYDIINLRILANNDLAISKPCNSCSNMLQSFGITKVSYSTRHGFQTLSF